MKMEITSIEDITIVKFVGNLDSSNAAVFRHKLSPITKKGGKFILDMTEVVYTTSGGLVLLHSTYADILNSSGKLTILSQGEVTKVLEITGISLVIPIFDKLDLAIAELKK